MNITIDLRGFVLRSVKVQKQMSYSRILYHRFLWFVSVHFYYSLKQLVCAVSAQEESTTGVFNQNYLRSAQLTFLAERSPELDFCFYIFKKYIVLLQ